MGDAYCRRDDGGGVEKGEEVKRSAKASDYHRSGSLASIQANHTIPTISVGDATKIKRSADAWLKSARGKNASTVLKLDPRKRQHKKTDPEAVSVSRMAQLRALAIKRGEYRAV